MKKLLVFGIILTLIFGAFMVTVVTAKPTVGYKKHLEKITFIHYKRGFAKPTCNNNGVCEPELGEKKNCADCKNGGEETSNCYGFISRGFKWKTTEDFYINPANPDGLSSAFIKNIMIVATDEWNKYTTFNIFGSAILDNSAGWGEYNEKNEISFGDYPQTGVIAVTNIWGYFSGPPGQREILEYDIMFDTDFTWGDATVINMTMDLQNIAVHEFGHGAGMDDLYTTSCSLETMYGYSTEGETIKRDLHTGDIIGIQKLYA
ncbi:MAG: matrixin family metalloprotease [Candidatus Aenigmarchaeota archaeon]|nr:matrixin family metalloprotease [Candidatus Aenigmarchaeota archaeon]